MSMDLELSPDSYFIRSLISPPMSCGMESNQIWWRNNICELIDCVEEYLCDDEFANILYYFFDNDEVVRIIESDGVYNFIVNMDKENELYNKEEFKVGRELCLGLND